MSASSTRLIRATFDNLIARASLIEQDAFGPKVYDLMDGRMLKLFRIKRLLSSNLWSPYAKRFVRHSHLLKEHGFHTITVEKWGKIPHLQRQFVLYEKLPGRSLRESTDWEPEHLGHYFARLHARGVLFRSCHLGNLLWLPQQDIGLIDIMDMRVLARPLSEVERYRNFGHLTRRQQDRSILGDVGDRFFNAYEANVPPGQISEELRQRFLSLLSTGTSS